MDSPKQLYVFTEGRIEMLASVVMVYTVIHGWSVWKEKEMIGVPATGS